MNKLEKTAKRFTYFTLNEDTYTLDKENWIMTCFEDGDEIVINDARVVAQVMSEGVEL